MQNNLKKVCIKAKIPSILKVFFDFFGVKDKYLYLCKK